MPVIAMTREMGSGGREIAALVAERLGLTVILHELVEHDLAEHMHARESTIHHLLEGGATLRERWQIGRKRLARYTAEEVLELAARGNVLLTPNERRVAEDRPDCYWLYVVTNCDTSPVLQEPIRDPARFPWHEVTKVAHYWLEVDAMTKPIRVREGHRHPYA